MKFANKKSKTYFEKACKIIDKLNNSLKVYEVYGKYADGIFKYDVDEKMVTFTYKEDNWYHNIILLGDTVDDEDNEDKRYIDEDLYLMFLEEMDEIKLIKKSDIKTFRYIKV